MLRRWQESIDMERRLRAAGVPLEVGEDDYGNNALPANGLFITQTGDCSALELDPSGVGYMLELRIVPNFPWPFEISTIELELPWQDPFLHWIPDPLETNAKDGMYWLPTKGGLGYARNQAINHHIGSGKRFSRGRSEDFSWELELSCPTISVPVAKFPRLCVCLINSGKNTAVRFHFARTAQKGQRSCKKRGAPGNHYSHVQTPNAV